MSLTTADVAGCSKLTAILHNACTSRSVICCDRIRLLASKHLLSVWQGQIRLQRLVLSTPTKQDFALVWQYDDVVEGKDV